MGLGCTFHDLSIEGKPHSSPTSTSQPIQMPIVVVLLLFALAISEGQKEEGAMREDAGGRGRGAC